MFIIDIPFKKLFVFLSKFEQDFAYEFDDNLRIFRNAVILGLYLFFGITFSLEGLFSKPPISGLYILLLIAFFFVIYKVQNRYLNVINTEYSKTEKRITIVVHSVLVGFAIVLKVMAL